MKNILGKNSDSFLEKQGMVVIFYGASMEAR